MESKDLFHLLARTLMNSQYCGYDDPSHIQYGEVVVCLDEERLEVLHSFQGYEPYVVHMRASVEILGPLLEDVSSIPRFLLTEEEDFPHSIPTPLLENIREVCRRLLKGEDLLSFAHGGTPVTSTREDIIADYGEPQDPDFD